jgi:FKBP-type peptidyl-prolyl cis-trans isomerase
MRTCAVSLPASHFPLPASRSPRHLRPMRILLALPLLALACGPSTPRASVDTTNTAATAPAAPPPDLTRVDTTFAPTLHVSLGSMERRPSGLYVRDLKRGTGTTAASGRGVVVQYVGSLPDGTVFDDSRKRGKPARFILGDSVVIGGWDQGIVGMKVGGRRQLIVPPALGYGLAGKPGAIPSAATLVFDMELLEVR